MHDVAPWAKAFLVTLLVETPIVVAWFRRADPHVFRRIALAFYANLATHPIVWFVIPALGARGAPRYALSELFAWLGETLLFATAFRLDRRGVLHAALGCALANGASFGVGLALRWATGWV